ncbi:MAG: hypothetical protein KDB14_04805, partial [Planctomycetales bacterium]|nr:hypothetical protein [Planctomycetales bacterium]
SLLETHGGQVVADRFEHLAVRAGQLEIAKLPPGDYNLRLKQSGQELQVRVTDGKELTGYALGKNRHLELREPSVAIDSTVINDKTVQVKLVNAGPDTRVHLFATRFVPAFSPYNELAALSRMEASTVSVGPRRSLYIEDRSIGDEYDYILRRQMASKFPGNMLERPSLLLNPWALRSTDTTLQDARAGEAFGESADDAPAPAAPPASVVPGERVAAGDSDYATLNWLFGNSVLANLEPDKNGVVTADIANFGGGQHLRVVVVEQGNVVQASVSLPAGEAKRSDLRLANGFDPQSHLIQQKQIKVVQKGDTFVLKSIDSSRFEAYDSLSQVYRLYETLQPDAKFNEFRFILDWPKLTPEQRREKYSKYASHELNFFLLHKDPEFFAKVVMPYMANKRDKTFLDDFLVDGDVSYYLDPWRHGRLNVVERILIGRKIEQERQWVSKHVEELVAILPPDPVRFNQLFDTAVKGSQLSADESSTLGLAISGRLGRPNARYALGDLAAAATPTKAPPAPRAGDPAGVTRHAITMDADRDGLAAEVEEKQAGARQANRRRESAAAKADAKGESLARGGGGMGGFGGGAFGFDVAGKDRAKLQQLYQQLDQTKEWAENNYYQLPIEQQTAELVQANPFWRDYASHREGLFLSEHVAEASHSFTECILALSVLDLPFAADKHDVKFERDEMSLTAGSPVVMFHEEIREPMDTDEDASILVSQNLFRQDDRYRHENNQQLDKYVTDEFLTQTVYGCQIVVTNPTSAPQKLSLLTQIPVGALPLQRGKETQSVHLDLQPYHTQTVEFYFYFPAVGKYEMYPVHVSHDGTLLANAEPRVLNVVESLSRVDRTSWAYISQNGTNEEVLDYLRDNNLQRTNLDKIAFRMGEPEYFETVTGLLVQRHVYNRTLWSYGVRHNQPTRVNEFLRHEDGFVSQCGPYLESPLLTIQPVERKIYQHLDYRPLVNARRHQLGARRQILNDRLFEQYQSLLNIHSFVTELNDDDRMSATYYLLLQDRVEDALEMFADVNPQGLETGVQHDYFVAYLGFYTGDLDPARTMVEKYADYPVDRWQRSFAAIGAQLREIDGGASEVIDQEDRDQRQAALAANAPSFDFKVESGKITLSHANVASATVNYYLMDIELLFSRNPFVKQYSGQFSHIKPNQSQTVALPGNRGTKVVALPKSLDNRNVLVEITAGGVTKTDAYYSNSLSVQLSERYGQVRVADQDGKPLSKSYVKVFAQLRNGQVKFYKDGYTDLRGRFDYASLSTNELDQVQRFSVLVMSEQHGALVKEASPPAR